jgi:hypothetical protein
MTTYTLTYGEAPPDAEPIAITTDLHEAKKAAYEFLKDFYPDLTGEQLLVLATFVFNENNWVRDPFGTTMYCNMDSRENNVDLAQIGNVEMSFIINVE